MAITYSSNLSALRVQSRIARASGDLSTVLQQLSSGQRINRPSDDAAGLQLLKGLESRSKIYGQGLRNINDSVSLLNIADNTIGSLQSIVLRQRELAQQSASGVLSSAQRASLQSEFSSLQEEYNRILSGTRFNSRSIYSSGEGFIDTQAGLTGISLAYRAAAQPGEVEGTGSYTQLLHSMSNSSGLFVAGITVRDLDNDGLDDLVNVYAGTDPSALEIKLYVDVYRGQSNGNYVVSSFVTEILPVNSAVVNLGEILASFNADGSELSIEIAYQDTDIGETSVYANAEFIGASVNSLASGGAGVSSNILSTLSSGDFNGDGVQDLVSIQNVDELRFLTQQTTAATYQGLAQSGISISSLANAQDALSSLEELSDKLVREQGTIGASLSRLDSALRTLSVKQVESEAAISRIRDIDSAEAVSELTRIQILRDLGSSIYAQANQQPSLALSLLEG